MIRVPLAIDPRHPAFEGHFPSRPIVPGVVLLDESLRALARHRGAASSVRFRIGAIKFLSFVGPGEPVELEVEGSGVQNDGYRLRVFAGLPDHRRLALSGSVSFDPSSGAPR